MLSMNSKNWFAGHAFRRLSRMVDIRAVHTRAFVAPNFVAPAVVALAVATLTVASTAMPATAQSGLEGYRLVDTWTTREPQGLAAFGSPSGLDVAPDDTIFVADSGKRAVHTLRPDGTLIQTFDVAPGGDRPIDVATTGDRFFTIAVNAGEARSAAGAVQGNWTAAGMTGIAVGPDRTIYVARLERGNFGLQPVIDLRDASGNLRETWSDNRTFIERSCGLDVGPDGAVYLSADGAIYVWRDGQIEAQLRLRRDIEGPMVTDVAVDGNHNVYAVRSGDSGSCGGGPVTDRYLIAWPNVAGATGVVTSSVARQLRGAIALAIGPGQGLTVATVDGTSFQGLTHVPNRLNLDAGTVRWGVVDESLGVLIAPQRLTVTPAGDVLFSDRQDLVQRWNSDGLPLEQWDAELISDVAALGEDPCILANLAISCLTSGAAPRWTDPLPEDSWVSAIDASPTRLARLDIGTQRLDMFDASGQPAGGWPLPSSAGFGVFSDVTLDGPRVFLADRAVRQVHVFGLDGTIAQPPIILPAPALRLAARDGALYTLTRDGIVLKYDYSGTPRAAFRPLTDGLPSDMAVGPNGRVYISDPATNRILVYEPGGTPTISFPEAPDLRCTVEVDKRAAPTAVRIGEAVQITLAIGGNCPEGDGRLDVALIVDRSGSMRPKDIAAAQNAVVSFLGELTPGAAQVTLVTFASDATVVTPLTDDLRQVVRGARGLTSGGMTRIDLALQSALTEMTGPDARDDVPRVAILMTDGQPTTNDEGPTRSAAAALKRAGVELYTIGLGDGIDASLLRDLASRPEVYFEAKSELDLVSVYSDIGRLISATELLQSATVIDILPPDMSYVVGSARPAANWNAATRTLTWSLADVPTSGLRLVYRVQPTRTGTRPTNVEARIDFSDAGGIGGTMQFPVPSVTVESSFIMLPYVSRNVCRPQRVDVAFVVDTSSSMRSPSRPGASETKLDAALAAVRVFIDEMALPQDQAALVTFDSTVRLDSRLTGVRGALEFAISRVVVGQGTRIDLGLVAAFNELIGSRHKAGSERVIILLTDGAPTPGTEVDVLRRAREARAAGMAIYTVALGTDPQLVLLSVVANDPSRSFVAPDASQLRAIYQDIAGRVLCD